MRGKWNIREWEAEFWRSFFEKEIKNLEVGHTEKIDLTQKDLCPENVIDVLRNMGYEDEDYDTNGWEQDTWISFFKEGEKPLMLFYCGRTFEMNLSILEEEN